MCAIQIYIFFDTDGICFAKNFSGCVLSDPNRRFIDLPFLLLCMSQKSGGGLELHVHVSMCTCVCVCVCMGECDENKKRGKSF